MSPHPTRRKFLQVASVGSVALAGCLGGSDSPQSTTDSGGDQTQPTDSATGESGGSNIDSAWFTSELTDVNSGETFTVEGLLDRPILLETFAVWCSNCLRQQKELITFHEMLGDEVTTVALDIDPNEDAQLVREHTEKHGFDWRYAISPGSVTQSLVDEFGSSMASPPVVPMLLICPDGSVTRLKDGHKTTGFLREYISQC
ncbi:TlpA family protein disulfide reductase [Haloferax sp. DFSO60]|uniref:TlpA family protein disulfide reductase n=1 Tax=Haloferax sp. DFSO60 TaxID=3388652 RepID=UPI00397CC862